MAKPKIQRTPEPADTFAQAEAPVVSPEDVPAVVADVAEPEALAEQPGDSPVPACVEVVATCRLQVSPWHHRQPWVARPGDVHSGEQAAWLWEHARECVVPFPAGP